MIAFIRGKVAAVTLNSAVLDVNGVGYELLCTPNTLAPLRLGLEVTMPAVLVVREESQTLFGFGSDDEKQMFLLVQIAGGVGPKLAQAMLAVLTPDGIRAAIANDDPATLTQVPGIGTRSAQRIILELKDRVGSPFSAPGESVEAAISPDQIWRAQVREGLIGLGYNAKDAERAVEAVAPEAGDSPNTGALLRAALKTLSKA